MLAATMPKAKPARPVTKAAANVPMRNIARSNDTTSATSFCPDASLLDVTESDGCAECGSDVRRGSRRLRPVPSDRRRHITTSRLRAERDRLGTCVISAPHFPTALRASRQRWRTTGKAYCQQSIVSLPCLNFSHEGPSMLRRLPSLNALKAFETAARHESFTRAAEELCVTQGAVSHQVKALEAELGIKLFNRERQRLLITAAGREYLTVVRDALDRIAVGTDRLVQRQSSGVLTVSTSPDFAAKWLVYRLGRFAEAPPDIDLRISATLHHVDFAREEVDLAVRHGDGNWAGLDVT